MDESGGGVEAGLPLNNLADRIKMGRRRTPFKADGPPPPPPPQSVQTQPDTKNSKDARDARDTKTQATKAEPSSRPVLKFRENKRSHSATNAESKPSKRARRTPAQSEKADTPGKPGPRKGQIKRSRNTDNFIEWTTSNLDRSAKRARKKKDSISNSSPAISQTQQLGQGHEPLQSETSHAALPPADNFSTTSPAGSTFAPLPSSMSQLADAALGGLSMLRPEAQSPESATKPVDSLFSNSSPPTPLPSGHQYYQSPPHVESSDPQRFEDRSQEGSLAIPIDPALVGKSEGHGLDVMSPTQKTQGPSEVKSVPLDQEHQQDQTQMAPHPALLDGGTKSTEPSRLRSATMQRGESFEPTSSTQKSPFSTQPPSQTTSATQTPASLFASSIQSSQHATQVFKVSSTPSPSAQLVSDLATEGSKLLSESSVATQTAVKDPDSLSLNSVNGTHSATANDKIRSPIDFNNTGRSVYDYATGVSQSLNGLLSPKGSHFGGTAEQFGSGGEPFRHITSAHNGTHSNVLGVNHEGDSAPLTTSSNACAASTTYKASGPGHLSSVQPFRSALDFTQSPLSKSAHQHLPSQMSVSPNPTPSKPQSDCGSPQHLRRLIPSIPAVPPPPAAPTAPAAYVMPAPPPLPEDFDPLTLSDSDFMYRVKHYVNERRNQVEFNNGVGQARKINFLFKTAKPAGPTEALFLTLDQAAAQLAPNEYTSCPIITDGGQSMNLQAPEDFLNEFYNEEAKIHIQDPSIKPTAKRPAVRPVTIRELKHRFAEKTPGDQAWNCLELATHVEDGLRPSFLNSEDCRLLTKLKHPGTADKVSRQSYDPGWKEVEKWALLAQAGALTEPHQDSHGFSTYITVNHGLFGFGWLSNPSAEERRSWNSSPENFIGGSWRYVVLRPGQTVFFPGGTVHFVFRLPEAGNTLAFGGHVLRCSQIVRWAKILIDEKKNSNVTNEELTVSAPEYLARVETFVTQALASGATARWGGKEACEEFLRLKREFGKTRKRK